MEGRSTPRTPSGRWKAVDSQRGPQRMIQRGAAAIITVYEREPADASGDRVLVFETAEFTIQLRAYPQDWNRMTDDQLIALSQK